MLSEASISQKGDGTYMVLWSEEAESGRWELFGRDFQTREESEAFVRSKGMDVKTEDESGAPGEEDPDLDLFTGVTYMAAKHWANAVRAFESVLRKNPDEVQARHYLGVAYCQLDRFAEGAQELRAAIRLDPEDPEPHAHLALAYMAMERQADAVAELTIVARLRPDDGEAQFDLAIAQGKSKNYPECLRAARRAAELGHDPAKEFLAGLE